MLEVGKTAPAFTLQDSDGKPVSLKDFKGQQVVVYFYPKDNTPGCTQEALDFNAMLKKFEKVDAVILGVSKDSIESHCKFRNKHSLKLTLLSDPEGAMIEKYGAWGEKNNYGKKYMGIIRSTVVVGADGKIKAVFPKVKVAGHAEKVLEALKEK
jgi:thioredoxin-dependent peroxiredoxin